MLVKLRMLTEVPEANLRKGQLIEVDPLRAEIMLKNKVAEEVKHGSHDPEER